MVKQLTFSDNEIYTLFHDLDRISGIMEPRLGRWHAWPAVKMQLFWPLMFETWRGNLQENSSGATAKFHNWLKAYLPCLGLAGRNFFRLRSLSGRGGNTVFMCAPRYALCPGGKRREFIFDDLTSGAGQDAPPILLAYPWPDTVRRNPLRGGEFRLDARLFAANHLAVLLAHSPSVAGPAERLLSMLDGKGLPYAHASLKRRVHSALAIFKARRRLFRRLFSTLRPRVIVTTYAPGKFGELAAALASRRRSLESNPTRP